MNVIVNQLTHIYTGRTLFKDLSFKVGSGQKICVLGQSGSGKSTLLKALIGLVVPTAGDILIGDEPLTENSIWRLRANIAYVAQEPDLGDGLVIDRIQRPYEYHANAHLRWDHNALGYYCEQFHLDEQLLYKNTSDLSGGEKQRIALIIALLLKRPILVLDEPVSAVDKDIKTSIKDELLRESKRTVFFTSHETVLRDIADNTIDLSAAERTD